MVDKKVIFQSDHAGFGSTRRGVLLGAAAGVSALFAGQALIIPEAAQAETGDGFEINNAGAQTRPTYTLRFSSENVRATILPFMQRAVNELHSFVNTRILFGDVGARTAAGDEIYVSDAYGGSCGSSAWGSWDGCGTYILTSNYISSSQLQLRMSAFNKSSTYVHALVSHELGHALGLLHTPDATQLMHKTVDNTDYAFEATYKRGDRNGLRYLSRNTPAP